MKKKILFVVNVDWFFISHRLPIATAAINAGYEVHIATRLTDSEKILSKSGLHVHDIEFSRSNLNFIEFIKCFFNLWILVRKIKPNIVHTVTLKAALFGGLVSVLSRVPDIIVAISGLGDMFTKFSKHSSYKRLLIKILFLILGRYSGLQIIFQNKVDREVICSSSRIDISKTILLNGSGVDLSTFYPRKTRNSSEKIILIACRLLYKKGVHDFVKAAKIYNSQRPEESNRVKFVIVGMYDPKNPSAIDPNEIETWSNEENIEYWGNYEELSGLMNKAYMFVLPSLYGEGLPLVLCEAAASGIPVITTDHPGCRDAIISGVTGLLIDINSPKNLCIAIMKLIDDEKLSQSMGDAGRILAEKKFSIDTIVDTHLDIYARLHD